MPQPRLLIVVIAGQGIGYQKIVVGRCNRDTIAIGTANAPPFKGPLSWPVAVTKAPFIGTTRPLERGQIGLLDELPCAWGRARHRPPPAGRAPPFARIDRAVEHPSQSGTTASRNPPAGRLLRPSLCFPLRPAT